MAEVYRAVDQPVDARLDYWHHVMSSVIFPSDVRFAGVPGERDWIRTGRVGPVQVAEWSSGPKHLERRARHIAAGDTDRVHVVVPTGAPVRGGRRDRRYVLPPRSMSLSGGWEQVVCDHGHSAGVNLFVPRALSPVPPRLLDRHARPVPGDTGVAALAVSLLVQLPAHLDQADPTVGARLASAALGLLAAAYADEAVVPLTDADSSREALRAQVRSFIEDHLGDPTLDPTTIAAAHHLSVRTLHKLFEAEPTSVAALIRRRRLERSREALVFAAGAPRTVEAVARTYGFVSLPHFTRAFRDAFGLPPGEYRRLVLGR